MKATRVLTIGTLLAAAAVFWLLNRSSVSVPEVEEPKHSETPVFRSLPEAVRTRAAKALPTERPSSKADVSAESGETFSRNSHQQDASPNSPSYLTPAQVFDYLDQTDPGKTSQELLPKTLELKGEDRGAKSVWSKSDRVYRFVGAVAVPEGARGTLISGEARVYELSGHAEYRVEKCSIAEQENQSSSENRPHWIDLPFQASLYRYDLWRFPRLPIAQALPNSIDCREVLGAPYNGSATPNEQMSSIQLFCVAKDLRLSTIGYASIAFKKIEQ